ncbi:MAG: phosphoadenylyl-sulfate reductase, partial [Planctomycetota bacterium]
MPATTPDLDAVNADLARASAADTVRWAAETAGDGLVLTTSFGVQSAVMLHLVTRVRPDVPVIFIDTGFHFAETYRFADQLTDRLRLNLRVYAPDDSPAWFVARHGQLWASDDPADRDRYDRLRKVEPMDRALDDLGATAVLAGLRRQQTDHRRTLRRVETQAGRL